MRRGPLADIDLAALGHNVGVIRARTGGRGIIAVVKADAYGHSAVEVARRLVSAGVEELAVAYVEEALLLREAGLSVPIIVFIDQESPEEVIRYGLTPVLRDLEGARKLSALAEKKGALIPVHMKIDTGMGRIGFHPDLAEAAAGEIAGLPGLRLEALMSHFAEAERPESDFTQEQIRIFESAGEKVRLRTGLRPRCHMANSAALFSLPAAQFDAVRPGIALYGSSPEPDNGGLRPVMRVSSRLLAVRALSAGSSVSYGGTFRAERDCRIAVVPVGYADGYSRSFSNNAEMLIRGLRAPVAGIVCMDMTMLDVTHIPDVSEGDEVVLLGCQEGEQISARELALRSGTIPYEILTSLGSHARKAFLN